MKEKTREVFLLDSCRGKSRNRSATLRLVRRPVFEVQGVTECGKGTPLVVAFCARRSLKVSCWVGSVSQE